MNKLYVLDNLKTGGGRTIGINYLKQSLMNEKNSYYIIPDDSEYSNIIKYYSAENRTLSTKNARKFRVTPKHILFINKYIKRNKISNIINLTNIPLLVFVKNQSLLIHKAHLVLPLMNEYIEYNNTQRVRIFLEKIFIQGCINLNILQNIIVQTKFMKRKFNDNYNLNRKVKVVPSGSTLEKHINIRENPFKMNDSKKLFVPTSLAKHKNNEYIIEVAKLIEKNKINVEFYITLPHDSYKKEIKENHLSHIINLLDNIPNDEIDNYYEHCDAVFLPTLLESFGLPYVEGIIKNKFIITSDLPFSKEVCQNSGIYFNPYNPKSGLKAINHFLNHEDFMEKSYASINPYIVSWEDSFNLLINGEE